jgi:tetratricopeptide (TPR) repeat protein
MIYRLLVLTAILFLHTSSFASPYSKWWDEGNRFYKQKQYDSAAVYFEKIAALKPHDAEVYYNLGNTYYRLNEIGAAVLNYERALKIAPDHKQATDNLALTENRIAGQIPSVREIFFVRWWNAITPATSVTTWAVISLVFFLALITMGVLKVMGKVKLDGYRIYMLLGSIWIVTLTLSFSAASHDRDNAAVIMLNGTNLMSDTKQGKSLLSIPEGTKVEIVEETPAMLQISLPDSRKGWVDRSSLTKI